MPSIKDLKQTKEVKQTSISSKISRKMTLQACLIALVAVLAIGFSSIILEQFLVREALNREAIHYWQIYNENIDYPAPNTDNLKGYLTIGGVFDELPEELRGYALGYHKIHGQTEHSLLFVSQEGDQRLHLLFDGESVTRLAIFFGVVPLTIILILIYITAWWVYRESNILLSPIVWLANKFDEVDPRLDSIKAFNIDDVPGDVDWEVEKLIKSFRAYSIRINRFIERERTFTRDASHEFRTPLTVIQMASDMLSNEPDLNKYSKKYVEKIKNSTKDIGALIDVFLVLARETYKEFDYEDVEVVKLVENEVSASEILLENKSIEVRVDVEHDLILHTAKQVLSIVLGNLIRNAMIYTKKGQVVVTVKEQSVVISDTGIGMDCTQIERIFQPYYRVSESDQSRQKSNSRKGYGVGLTIVKRLSNRFNWTLDVKSKINQGTNIEVFFN